ncbi:peptidoglycan-binding domain-containing protein [Oceanobacillus timonensis]|uniref:peptidoglycan-binding domain-containing protein n=1 Tax=Oceanobacillus timonensis TaxID=1926285 RepID=UPI0009BAC25A|nr:peptidoglycan-binding domain-containing protein [Oceanobacillus timonensis]
MKKKWLAVVPAVTVALAGAPHINQTVDAAPENESVQQAESEVPAGYEAILNWPPEQQPTVKHGSQKSFEVEFIQVMLNHFGFETEVDGVFGSHTDQQVHQLQAENGLVQDGIIGVGTWAVLLEEYQAELFTVETAIAYAEKNLDNEDLVFSSNGELHRDLDGKVFYSLKAQSQDLIDNGGTGTVGFYDVYQNGDVIESKPR